ncbi:MAG: two-component regulator propeller domain-containing protein [Bacteroidales bacterium]
MGKSTYTGNVKIRNFVMMASLWLWIMGAMAQSEVRFEEAYAINDLSNNMVTCMHQDQLGFLWLGTFNGLNKYDGYSYRIYKFNEPGNGQTGTSTNRIISIREDQRGILWIETYDGKILYFNPATEEYRVFPIEGESPEQTRCTGFYETEDGMICISTDMAGVFFVRYTASEAGSEVYHMMNSSENPDLITSNNVSFVVQDENNYFWIGTDKGLNRIRQKDLFREDPPVMQYYTSSGENLVASVSFSHYAVQGTRLWFANDRHGLLWYETKTEEFDDFSHHPRYSHMAEMEITTLEIRGRNLWAGTANGVLLRYNLDTRSFSEYPFTDARSGKEVKSIHIDLFDQVWLLTDNFGITRFDPSYTSFSYYRLTPKKLENLTDAERIRIYEDSRNQLWLGGQNTGILHYDRQEDRFNIYRNEPGNPRSLQSDIVECIMEDREHNLWIGTSWFGKGLNRMITMDPAFEYIVPVSSPESKQQNVVRALFVDSKGYIWAGTKSGQIYIYDPELTLIHIVQEDPEIQYTGYNVYSIGEDQQGRIWLCTKGAGVFYSNESISKVFPHYDKLTFSSIEHIPDQPNSLSNNNVYDMIIDEMGRIWVATYGGGLNMIDTDKEGIRHFHHYTSSNSSLTSDKLRDLHLTRNGRLWLATTMGVNYIDIYRQNGEDLDIKSILSIHSDKGGLSYNDIIMVMEDKAGHLWLASAGGGVNQILNPDGEDFEFVLFSEKNGLKDDYIVSISEDIYGFLWFGTISGLSRYNPLKNDIENFDKKIGLPEVFFSERTSAVSSSGRVLFGTVNGFYVISPQQINFEEIDPNISLTEMMLNNEIVKPGHENSPISMSLPYLNEITLQYDQSNFSIEFSLLSFKSHESNHYAYILEGFNDEWIYIGTDHKAIFTNVPPGDYIFRAKGLDSNLSEYGTETSLEITILPPIWRTHWAYMAYIAIFLVLAYFSYRIALRFVRLKSNLKVEKRVAESKLRFFTNISHEIRTPLTLILGPIDSLIERKDISSDVRHQLTVIHRNSKRLLRMVNQLLDFRKVQNEKVALRIQEIEVIPFLWQIHESFESQARIKSISFNLIYDENDEQLTVWGDIQKLDIVIFNLLSNAFKFTPEKGRISIIVTREYDPSEVVAIRISDTGTGIPKDKVDLIFDRFFVSHTDEDNNYHGTGIGLSLSQEYIKLHKGEIKVESTKGQGTDLIVRLLTGNSHFPENVIIKEREAYSYTPKVEEMEDILPIEKENGEIKILSRNESLDKPFVLIVEDDVEMCHYLQKILEPTYKVETARDGLEGWSKASHLNPDLIITDVMMPEMNGIELTQKLKDDFNTCHIPVIMLSSKSAVESQVEGLQTGAEAYVPKPFNAKLLISYIQSFLTQRKKIREILQSKVELKPDEVKVTPKDKEFIEKVLHLIDEGMVDTDFNVEKLANEMYISRTLFYKKIKGITGYQPVELIRTIRLKKAAKYIETGEFTVSEVAYMVGYTDIRYFSTSFKKQFGTSPSQYLVK